MSLLFDTHASGEESHWVFPRKTLHMTEQLLRAQHPTLASQLHQALMARQITTAQNPLQLPYHSLTQVLDAVTVTRIIGALTELGREWLSHPDDHPVSFEPLKGLLNQWIELGEWIVHHSES